ncbi:Para-hydroxybenzoate--polyprenyltransferase, mitochondrial precursor (PHB:polyprenyltransferase) [Entomortierella beljakovae]|nr:Para-hydroxybenzoate--polyprenyltransferase, mitochondrial precursor (PHB:polyprenyltransferase) [Entomortierella beljakovae]
MFTCTGASAWRHAAMNAAKARHGISPAINRNATHYADSSCFTSFRIPFSPSQNHARRVSIQSWNSIKSRDLVPHSSMGLVAYKKKCQLPSNGLSQMYSTETGTKTIDGSKVEADITPSSWLDRMPKSIQPYLYLTRIDKPIAWGITMASYGANLPLTSTLYTIGLFGTGAIIMRGAGCTINDLWDRDIDNKVERTKVRPLASGAVSPIQAIGFLGLQLGAGLAVLTQLNLYSIILGASSLSLVVTYPAMKRITYWPQVVLGLAFNWGALLGSSAMLGAANWPVALPLYASGVCWTLVYDTIYAHQDKKDDVKIGVKSTALRFGERTPEYLAAFSTGMVSMLALAGYMNDQGPLFYALSVGGAAAHLAWQLKSVDYENPKDCWSKFASNKWAGALIFSGVAGDYMCQMMM